MNEDLPVPTGLEFGVINSYDPLTGIVMGQCSVLQVNRKKKLRYSVQASGNRRNTGTRRISIHVITLAP